MLLYTFALLGMKLDCSLMLQNIAFYAEARSISATQLRENEDIIVIDSPRSMRCTIVRSWFVLEPGVCSFFALRSWLNIDDCAGGQITAIEGKMLGKMLEILQNTSNNYTQA